MYCIDDRFYSEIDDMVESAIDEYGSIEEIPADFIIEYYECELRPIYKLDSGLLYKLIHDHFKENSWIIYLSIFVITWIFQFIGHKIEGKKPSFLKDLQFLLIGPIWLLHFILKKIGIPY